ncbi:DUF4384 domain-containing protein [Cricetibacter osteomyelitidis]|uniref:DUF4384 domain-containing protein n=1 Tax=Cricetibacter osteomyelitidis TaxID=1521931 RepID=UPI001FB3A11F|nr:DUF4384 domain-containing protein [Cricetibacter osteomyelitidis]
MHDNKAEIESTTTHTRPVSEPVRAMTSFSDSLSCMDDLLAQSNVGETIVAIKTINDASTKALVAANDMIVTSLSQMSRKSGAFKVVDFEVNPLKQDTVQTLTNLLLPTGNMQIPAPQIYISGAISYVDQNILTNNATAGVSVDDDVEAGVSGDLMTTALGMELHIGDFLTRTLYPGIDSANEIVAANKGFGFDGGARIRKVGVQFSFERNLSQGVGAAVRTLTDLGMIELVGKFARVPYWQCLSLDQSHPEFQRQLLDWFDSMGERERVKFFQTGLKNLGYYGGEVNGCSSAKLKQALALFQKDNNATPSGFINFESYERIMKNYAKVDASGNIRKTGMDASSADSNTEEEPRGGYPYFNSDTSAPIGLSINPNKSAYRVGDKLEFAVNADKPATHVSCFYQDSQNSIAQIYPNPLQAENTVSPDAPLRLPNGNAFSLDLSNKGNEAVLCIASYSSLNNRLQQTFGQPLTPIRVQSLDQLSDQLHNLFGDTIKGEQKIAYKIN